MYHAIVRRRVVDLFRAVSNGDAEPVLRTFATRFEHTFLGESALGGTRRTLSATRRWYQRPLSSAAGHQIRSQGYPRKRRTLEYPCCCIMGRNNSATDGVRTFNRGVHLMQLRWGRATRLVICPDTVGLKGTLDRLGTPGNAEALALPIFD